MGRLLGTRSASGALSKRQAFPEPAIPAVYGGEGYGRTGGGGASMRADIALQSSAVWACVGLVSNAVSMLPLETYRADAGGVPRRIPDPGVVTSPAAGMTQSEWLGQVMVSLLLRGNAYGHIVARDSFGRPTQIELWNPDVVRVAVSDAGTLVYTVGSPGKVVPADDVWHVRGLTMPAAKVGLSPIAYAAAQIHLDLSAGRFASDFFDGGGHPTSVLESDQAIDQTQAQTIKERFLVAATGRAPVVLGSGIKVTAIGVKPEESQFLATRQASVTQIARYFGVPASMVGGTTGDSMTYQNVEQRSLDFLTYAVQWWLKRLEDAFSALLPRGQTVAFKTAALLRTDSKTQAEVDVLSIAGKYRVPSEVRAEHGWAPFTSSQKQEADLVPLSVTPTGRPTGGGITPAPSGPADPATAPAQQEGAPVDA